MMQPFTQGEHVIVRTFGGYARIRRLWTAGSVGCVVAEDAAYERLLRGDLGGAVALPSEDVFRFDPAIAATIDPREPFARWEALTPVVG